MQISSEDQIVGENGLEKSDQLACIWYKNQNVLAFGYRDVVKVVKVAELYKTHYQPKKGL